MAWPVLLFTCSVWGEGAALLAVFLFAAMQFSNNQRDLHVNLLSILPDLSLQLLC